MSYQMSFGVAYIVVTTQAKLVYESADASYADPAPTPPTDQLEPDLWRFRTAFRTGTYLGTMDTMGQSGYQVNHIQKDVQRPSWFQANFVTTPTTGMAFQGRANSNSTCGGAESNRGPPEMHKHSNSGFPRHTTFADTYAQTEVDPVTAVTLWQFGVGRLLGGESTLPLIPIGTAPGGVETTYLYQALSQVVVTATNDDGFLSVVGTRVTTIPRTVIASSGPSGPAARAQPGSGPGFGGLGLVKTPSPGPSPSQARPSPRPGLQARLVHDPLV
ncbi:hypothetical protein GGX14DRAFT_390295 [Mycena pura]|uniref:Uncharacterized protein n=1 Tax=Mycena pura TaxID=153505 RepID=A0AAD6VSU1_9AGAR|nr:hypothetical protein GGX14DRAFT_390295 [Mycena pura]